MIQEEICYAPSEDLRMKSHITLSAKTEEELLKQITNLQRMRMEIISRRRLVENKEI